MNQVPLIIGENGVEVFDRKWKAARYKRVRAKFPFFHIYFPDIHLIGGVKKDIKAYGYEVIIKFMNKLI